jgi:hypothetical protein
MLCFYKKISIILLGLAVIFWTVLYQVPSLTHMHIDEGGHTSYHSHSSESFTTPLKTFTTPEPHSAQKQRHIFNINYFTFYAHQFYFFLFQLSLGRSKNSFNAFLLKNTYLEHLFTVRMTI